MSTPTDSLSCCKTEVKEESSLGGTDTDFNNLMVSEGYGFRVKCMLDVVKENKLQ